MFEIRALMREREDFAGKEKGTHIFKSDIFVTIRQELERTESFKEFKTKAEIISQLVQLSQVCTTEYVLVKDMCFN